MTIRAFLRPLLAPPPLPESEKTWVRRSVHVLSLSLAVVLVIGVANNLLRGYTGAVWLLCFQLGVVGVILWLCRHGAPARAARLLGLSLPHFAAGLLVAGNAGLHDPGVLVFPACLVVAGLLLERRTLVVLTAESVACVGLVLAVEGLGLVGHRPSSSFPLGDFVDATSILVVTAIGVGLVSGHIREALAAMRRSELALQEANDVLEERSERLRTSEARYRGLVDLAVDAILVLDSKGRITEVNRQATALTGYDKNELLGWRVERLLAPGELEREPWRSDLVDLGQAVVRERLLRRKDGSTVPVEMGSGRMPDGTYQSILRDVSARRRVENERRRLEGRLDRGRRMEAIGRLAGGVAHEYNNLLSAMTGNLALALRNTPPSERTHRWLKAVDTAAWRAADITRQLLTFARQGEFEPTTLDLRELLAQMRPVLERTVGDPVKLETHVPPEPCPVRVDRPAIERALVSLATNGRDSMPDGGTLSIELRHAAAEDVERANPSAQPVPHIELSVTDSGVGMTEDVKAHMFEPFFASKLSGGAGGLGLALVYTVVEGHDGWIDIESAPAQGTTFRIHLPRSDGVPATPDG